MKHTEYLIRSILVAVIASVAHGAQLPAPIADASMQQRTTSDERVRAYVLPKRILWHTDSDSVQAAQMLLQKRSGQTTLDASNPCVLKSEAAKPGILLDFGKELHGGVQIMVWHTKDNKPVRLRVRFGESASEAMAEFGGAKNTTNDHAIRDQRLLVPWLGTAEIGNTGFRFVRIDLEDKDSFVQLKSVRAIFIYRDLEYQGAFRCSDERHLADRRLHRPSQYAGLPLGRHQARPARLDRRHASRDHEHLRRVRQ